MRKTCLLMLLPLLFAACGPASGSEPSVENDVSNSVEVEEQQSEPTQPVAPTAVIEDEADTTDARVEPLPATAFPAQTPAEATTIRSRDHVLGASEPLITIIEYGDFQ